MLFRSLLAVAVLLILRPREAWRANAGERRQGLLLGLFTAAGLLLVAGVLGRGRSEDV